MSRLTTDPDDNCIKHGLPDETPVPQNSCYLVLSEEERKKGFLRPVRMSYRHVGIHGPRHPLRDLTPDEKARFGDSEFAKFEEYPPSDSSAIGRWWSQKDLDRVGKGCGTVTTMGRELSETYARNPHFYGATYCVRCSMHRPVGRDGEFVWEGTEERVGT